MVRWFAYVWDTTSFHAVLVVRCESNRRDTSGAWCVVEEHAALGMSLRDQEKTTSLAKGRRAFEGYKAKKGVSRCNIDGNGDNNELKVIPSEYSSQFWQTLTHRLV